MNSSDTCTCHCCEGLSVQTPATIDNRPGLSSIVYRVGDYNKFKESLIARLSLSGDPTLGKLTTRSTDDFTIALLDAWSVMADVLTFYNERIANESYLSSAKERLSVLELARLIGYELSPGVSASTYVAFTLDDTPGALGAALRTSDLNSLQEKLPPIRIARGTKVQSVPGPGERAQTFETKIDIEARPEWNAMKPRRTMPQVPLQPDTLVFNAVSTGLRVGDVLLVERANVNTVDLRKISKLTINNEFQTTQADSSANVVLPGYQPPVVAARATFNRFVNTDRVLNQSVVRQIRAASWRESDFSAIVKINRWSAHEVAQAINFPTPEPPDGTNVYALRRTVFPFGYNAPMKVTYDGNVPVSNEWDHTEADGVLYLDGAYEDILEGSKVVIQNPQSNTPLMTYKVDKVNITARTAYGLSTKTTALSLSPKKSWWAGTGQNDKLSALRSITIFAQSQELSLAELPTDDFIEGSTITLEKYYPGLVPSLPVIVTGERADLNSVVSSEVATLADVIINDGLTTLSFVSSLVYKYKPGTVTVCANVAEATNGETVEEILGSGDSTVPFQKFHLKQPPLTYTSAQTSSGSESSLDIRVNDILWNEVDYFYDRSPDERIYTTRRDNEGNTIVTFGDGINGARLPTGAANIKARYRKGIGLGGTVKANQLSQLMTVPLGVKSVNNPVSASGAEDPEVLEDAKVNAPLTILALRRVVSLQDYEDFTRAFAGIGKSLATWAWRNRRRHIYITVAGSDHSIVRTDSKLYSNLLMEIRKAGDATVAVTVRSYTPAFFQVEADIRVNPAYVADNVLAAADERLRTMFSFENRSFGQPVNYSEVVGCIQGTEGVEAVDINYLFRSDAETPDLLYHLESAMPSPADEDTIAAELLLIDPRPIRLTILS